MPTRASKNLKAISFRVSLVNKRASKSLKSVPHKLNYFNQAKMLLRILALLYHSILTLRPKVEKGPERNIDVAFV